MCHKIKGLGVGFGPDLTQSGKERTIEEIVHEIVYPDEKLAHGYDKPVRLISKRTKNTAEGLLSNYSWHAGSLKLKIMGGDTRKILFRRAGKVEYLMNLGCLPPRKWVYLIRIRRLGRLHENDCLFRHG